MNLELCAKLAILAVVVQIASSSGSTCPTNSYTFWGQNGPSAWAKLFPIFCANISRQSPINIEHSATTQDSELASNTDFTFSTLPTTTKLKIENDGLKVHLAYTSSVTLSGFGLPDSWKLDHIHIHWGADDSKGSEHYLDSKQHAAEVHIVFYNSKYATLQDAAANVNGLAVLGVLLKAGAKNDKLDLLFSKLDSIINCGQEVETEADSLSPVEFLPKGCARKQYYRYYGSLTTPKCNEVVIWTVFAAPVEVSGGQLAKLRKLKYSSGGETGVMVDNFRPPQNLNQRPVRRSFDARCGAGSLGLSVGALALVLAAFVLVLVEGLF